MTAVVVIYVVPEFIVIFEIGYHDLYYHWLNFIICTIIIHYQLVLVLFTGLLVIFKNRCFEGLKSKSLKIWYEDAAELPTPDVTNIQVRQVPMTKIHEIQAFAWAVRVEGIKSQFFKPVFIGELSTRPKTRNENSRKDFTSTSCSQFQRSLLVDPSGRMPFWSLGPHYENFVEDSANRMIG